MLSFKEWLKEVVNPDAPEVENPLIMGVGAMPVYNTDDLPPTPKNREWANRRNQNGPDNQKMLEKWMKRKMNKK